MKNLRCIFLAVLSFVALIVNAQELSQSDKEALQNRVKAKVEEFQGYLSSIVNTGLSDIRRNTAKESALALFMGEGDPYYIYNENNERERHREVRIQVSSVNRTNLGSRSMKKYLQDTYNNIHNYHKVTIQSADAVRVDNIYKVGEGQYECMAYFGQKYISYGKDGKVIYGDITTKKVKVHIIAKEIPTVGTIFEAKLGDIYVESTKRIWK